MRREVVRTPTTKEMPLIMAGSTKYGRYPKMSVEQTWNMFVSVAGKMPWLVRFPGYASVSTIADSTIGSRGLFASTRFNHMVAVHENVVYIIDDGLFVNPVGTLDTYGGDVYFAENNNSQIAISDLKNIYVFDYLNSTFEKAATSVLGVGTITTVGTAVTGVGTTFTTDVSIGDFILVNNEKRIIASITNDLALVLESAFSPDIGSAISYSYGTPGVLDFIPGQIEFHDGYIIAAVQDEPAWRLSALNYANDFPAGAANVGGFQTKPDNVKAIARIPGRARQIFVIGNNVIEPWTDIGASDFPYERATGIDVDYGAVSVNTIAQSDNFVVWLGANEKSSPVIMLSSGGDPVVVGKEEDGVNFKLSQLEHPEDSYGFLFRQENHLFYLLTFPTDNFSIVYDFNTQAFFNLSDPKMNHHIAKKVVFFNNKYYFISFNDGLLYQLSSNFTTSDGDQQVCIRIPNTIRSADSTPFVVNTLNFRLAQGNSAIPEAIDTSVSYDGGVSFGNSVRTDLNTLGNRQNIFDVWDLGYGNEFTPQFRFYGEGEWVIGNGVVEVYQ